MKTIKLYGQLAKRFGRSFKFDVASPAEAVRALSVNLQGFKQFLISDIDNTYTIFVGSEDQIILDLHHPSSDRDVIRIVPMVNGAGSIGRIIVGGFLIWATGGMSTAFGGALGGGIPALQGLGFLSTALGNLGWALMLGGISSLLFSPPKQESYEAVENQPSYIFNGAVNTTRQGNPVPIGYGRMRVGSQVISAGLQAQAL